MQELKDICPNHVPVEPMKPIASIQPATQHYHGQFIVTSMLLYLAMSRHLFPTFFCVIRKQRWCLYAEVNEMKVEVIRKGPSGTSLYIN